MWNILRMLASSVVIMSFVVHRSVHQHLELLFFLTLSTTLVVSLMLIYNPAFIMLLSIFFIKLNHLNASLSLSIHSVFPMWVYVLLSSIILINMSFLYPLCVLLSSISIVNMLFLYPLLCFQCGTTCIIFYGHHRHVVSLSFYGTSLSWMSACWLSCVINLW